MVNVNDLDDPMTPEREAAFVAEVRRALYVINSIREHLPGSTWTIRLGGGTQHVCSPKDQQDFALFIDYKDYHTFGTAADDYEDDNPEEAQRIDKILMGEQRWADVEAWYQASGSYKADKEERRRNRPPRKVKKEA